MNSIPKKEVNKLIEYKELPHKYVSMMKAFFAFEQNSELHWNSHLPHFMFLKQFYSNLKYKKKMKNKVHIRRTTV